MADFSKTLKLMKEKIINLINYVKSGISNIINIIPEKDRYIFVLILGMILLIEDYITTNRLITFSIVLIIISIYKITYKHIDIIIKVVKLKQETLLKIYKYKNPIIGLIIEIELKLFNIMYNIQKNNTNIIYQNIIYNILYNYTGLNGIKIVLYKFYVILNDGKKNTIYEIIFKRMYGMILSILIFTNLIQMLITILSKISTNGILGIYIFLLVISYIAEKSNLDSIEYLRKESNIIGLILIKKISNDIIELNTQEIQILIGIIKKDIKYMLNYENYLKYLILAYENKFNYNKPLYSYCYEMQNIFFETVYILIKNAKLKKREKNQNDIDLINYCEYNILRYKIILFYIGDIEKALNINETLFKIKKENIDFIGENLFIYEYDIKKFREIYNEKINSVKLNKFGDLIENKSFYEEMYIYLYDYDFINTKKCKILEELKYNYIVEDKYIEEVTNVSEQQSNQQLIKELENFKSEWNLEKSLQNKYYNIFKDIDIIKKKINA